MSNITGGNTRGVIELVTAFLGSPNVDARKIIRIEEDVGGYVVPLHEFTKHALLGEYSYFNAQSSLVACNIFDVSTADSREHFLASLIVALLSSNLGVKDNDGFVGGGRIAAEMAGLGFVAEQVHSNLRRLASKRLIETPHAHFRELKVDEGEDPEQFLYRATTVGAYHIRFWTGAFAFLDATSTDTPIFDERARDEIVKHARSFKIADRYRKTVCFKDYLEAQWFSAGFSADYYDFAALLKAEEGTFEAVRQFLERKSRERDGVPRRNRRVG